MRAQNELLYLISSPERYESHRDAGLDHPRGGHAALRRGSSLKAADKAACAMILCHRGCWMVWMADFEVRLALEVGHHLRPQAGSGPNKHRCRAESHWGHCADVWVALYMRLAKMILLV